MSGQSEAELGQCVQAVCDGWDVWDAYDAALRAIREDTALSADARQDAVLEVWLRMSDRLAGLRASYVAAGGLVDLYPARTVFSLPQPWEVADSRVVWIGSRWHVRVKGV